MMRVFLATTMALAAITGCNKPDPYTEVYQLARDNIWLYQPEPDTVCSAGFIGNGLFLTAAHCAEDAVAGKLKKDDVEVNATVVKSDSQSDLALLAADVEGIGLALAGVDPDFTHQYFVAGLPGALPGVLAVLPTRISYYGPYKESYRANSLGDEVWPGMSGGPLLDSLGRVVGVASYVGAWRHGTIQRNICGYAVFIMDFLRSITEEDGQSLAEGESGAPVDSE